MSSANGAGLPDITLVELERLIKMLGLLGSAHDGEVLAAARFVVRWLDEKSTSWEALLVPEEEPGVVSVGTLGGEAAARVAAEAEIKAKLDTAYRNGVRDGLARMAAQVKAQAGMGQASPNPYASPGAQQGAGLSSAATGLGAAWSGLGASWQQTTGSAQQPAQQAPGGPGGGAHAGHAGSTGGPLQLNPYPTGTWKWVAWELLERGKQGIPGVFRGSREESFVSDVLGRGFASLTTAQDAWLRDIAGRSGMSW